MAKAYMKFYTSELVGYIVKTNSGVVFIDGENDLYLDGADGAIFESKALAQSVARRLKRQWDLSWTKILPAMKVKREMKAK